MPDSYIKLAADWNGDGKRDIWGDTGDVFASIANYLAKSGWAEGAPWGSPATLPAGFDASQAGRDKRRSVADWVKSGVQPARALPQQTQAGVVLPGGEGGEAFLTVGTNFQAIRRYNPSDFYAIAVGLIGDAVMA
jgi:membrane-bound lytic murein transglycosylase B